MPKIKTEDLEVGEIITMKFPNGKTAVAKVKKILPAFNADYLFEGIRGDFPKHPVLSDFPLPKLILDRMDLYKENK